MRAEERHSLPFLLAGLQAQLRSRAYIVAGRRSGTLRAMSLLRQELAQINALAWPPIAPRILVIDEVGPIPAPPSALPRFAKLSCLRQRRR
jgi:hypothetical protein